MPETSNNEDNIMKKEGFFKTVLKSIKNFEKYEDFGLEGMGKTASYLLKIVAIFTLVVAIMTVYKFSNSFNSALGYFDENVKSLKYADGILKINDDEKLEVSSQNNITGKIIIDTSDLTEEQINEYRDNIKNEANGIVLLKEKLILKNEMLSAVSEVTYNDFFAQYNITSLNKQEILNYLNNSRVQIYSSVFITDFCES